MNFVCSSSSSSSSSALHIIGLPTLLAAAAAAAAPYLSSFNQMIYRHLESLKCLSPISQNLFVCVSERERLRKRRAALQCATYFLVLQHSKSSRFNGWRNRFSTNHFRKKMPTPTGSPLQLLVIKNSAVLRFCSYHDNYLAQIRDFNKRLKIKERQKGI